MSTPMFQVTYDNWLLGERKVLIDDIDGDTATKVLIKFGNKADPYFYMPGLRIEPMPTREIES